MAKRKIAKVINQYSDGKGNYIGCDNTVYGECECCGATVSHSSKGWDEECWKCGAELDWTEE